MRILFGVLCILTFWSNIFCQKINGITMVATPKPIDDVAFERVKKTNADWTCFVPYAFQRKGQNTIKFNLDKQWWGETRVGINKCLQMAKSNNLSAMLKPQIYIPGGWTGDIDFKSEEEWNAWENDYTNYIMTMAEMAVQNEIPMFCLGTELKIVCVKREKYMRNLIAKIRKIYKGKITYSANWDDYQTCPIWNDLDYIGISAYFPLTELKTPTLNTLEVKWKKIIKELESFSKKNNKKILFTEYGYLTADQCAWKTWEVESKIMECNENQEAQAIAFEALYKAVWDKDFFAGGFIWKWFPNGQGHEGYKNKDYDPQDKKAEAVVKKYYAIKN